METIIYVWLCILGGSEVFLSIQKKSKPGAVKKSNDRFSLLILWLVIPVCILVSILYSEVSDLEISMNAPFVFGLIISFLGSLIRWTAIAHLKDAFTVDVSILEAHSLVSTGIYSYVRHPSYTGLFLNYFGIWIAFQNVYLIIGLSLVTLAGIHYRIYVEEQILVAEFGEEYETYKQLTKKLLPFIY